MLLHVVISVVPVECGPHGHADGDFRWFTSIGGFRVKKVKNRPVMFYGIDDAAGVRFAGFGVERTAIAGLSASGRIEYGPVKNECRRPVHLGYSRYYGVTLRL